MNTRPGAIALTILLTFAVGLTGCETKRVSESMGRVDATADKANALSGSLRQQSGNTRKSVMFTNEQWVNTQPLQLKRGLPVTRDCDVGYNESRTLQEFAQWASHVCGSSPGKVTTPVQVTPDALDGGAAFMKNKGVARPTGPAPVASNDSISDLFPGGSTGSITSLGAAAPASTPSFGNRYVNAQRYEGRLSTLLDSVTGSLGLSWRYDAAAGAIKIYYLETRQFPIYAFNTTSTFKSEVKSGMSSTAGTSGGSGQGSSSTGMSGESGSSQNTQTDMVSSVLNDIEKNVRNMLTMDQMSFSRATGVINITDRPDVLDAVQAYLDKENHRITQQILINIEVISVKLSDKDQYGIDWSLVYKSVSGNWGFGLGNKFPGIDGSAVGGSISILDTASSPFAGSKAIVQALTQQGRVSTVRAPSVTTLNLQTAPVQVGKVKGYIASSGTTQTANVGTTSSLVPASITSGFNMALSPIVMPADELLMKIAINMSTEPQLDNFTSGDAKAQVPSYDLQIFDQTVKLQSGQTLVLSGFDQTTENASKSGVGEAWNWFFGGGGTRETNREVLVLLLTPIILG
ncbi:PilN family type IVB pilus formation outer membrane protein [Pseudomonas moraviensis]